MTAALTVALRTAIWAAHLARAENRTALREKPAGDWILDGANLIVQALAVPAVAAWVLAPALATVAPSAAQSVSLPPIASFLLGFVGVDYLYYWNHRALHTAALWPLHRVHHTATRMDVLATSRNTVWTTWCVVYVWATALFTFLLADPTPFLLASALTAGLDAWRHSDLDPPDPMMSLLNGWLILPKDHAWHHASASPHRNYGANLSIWDRLHGTWHAGPDAAPLGLDDQRPWWRRLLIPDGAP